MNRVKSAADLVLLVALAGLAAGCGSSPTPPEQFKGVTVNKDGSLGPPPEAERHTPADIPHK
jgi:uncharacterized lipoprotein